MRRLIRAALGASAEATDAVADRHAFHTLEWELRSVDAALAAALKDLTAVMAMEIAEQRRVQTLDKRIAEDEAVAKKALDAGKEPLALELAERIADLRQRRGRREAVRTEYSARVRDMRASIAKMEQRVTELRREFALERANAALQRVEAAAGGSGSALAATLAEAEATLDRIKRRQQKHADQMQAAAILEGDKRGDGLNERLRAAGLTPPERPSAAAILDELRARKDSAPAA